LHSSLVSTEHFVKLDSSTYFDSCGREHFIKEEKECLYKPCVCLSSVFDFKGGLASSSPQQDCGVSLASTL
jgi:hypothetical protein